MDFLSCSMLGVSPRSARVNAQEAGELSEAIRILPLWCVISVPGSNFAVRIIGGEVASVSHSMRNLSHATRTSSWAVGRNCDSCQS